MSTHEDDDFEGMLKLAITIRPELMYRVWQAQNGRPIAEATDAEYEAFESAYMAELQESASQAVDRFVRNSMANFTRRKYGRH